MKAMTFFIVCCLKKQPLTKHRKIVRDTLNTPCHLYVLTHTANYMLIKH